MAKEKANRQESKGSSASTAGEDQGNYISLEQFASPIGRPKEQRATLIGLRLNKIGRQSKLLDTPQVRGMLAKVSHLVRVISGG